MKIFCNIYNVFTVTFGHFNAFLLNKSTNYLKNIYLTQNFWTIVFRPVFLK